MSEHLLIPIARISEDGSSFKGELPPEAMDLEGDRFIRPKGPIHYDLRAEIVSGQVLVQGTVETELDLLCAACADFFSTTIRLSSFLHAYAIDPDLEVLDLTEDVREDILLEVPHYPRGQLDELGCCMVCGRDASKQEVTRPAEAPPETWSVLDKLNLENGLGK
jgi:uncharacterized metal-binding protein YceD (DUF177 family)